MCTRSVCQDWRPCTTGFSSSKSVSPQILTMKASSGKVVVFDQQNQKRYHNRKSLRASSFQVKWNRGQFFTRKQHVIFNYIISSGIAKSSYPNCFLRLSLSFPRSLMHRGTNKPQCTKKRVRLLKLQRENREWQVLEVEVGMDSRFIDVMFYLQNTIYFLLQ